MSDVKNKLNELLGKRGVMLGSDWKQKYAEHEERRKAGEFDIERKVPGEVVENESGSFYLVREDFPLEITQGPVPLGAALESIPEHVALFACDSDLESFNPETAIFIDTETTGLAGGTGTVPFLVGVGYFAEGIFRLEQCFMRDFDEEEPMLHYLDELFKRAETVVTFNGKSFDIPLLRTRCVYNRIPFRLDAAMHFDLVHAARRLWRLRLKDCSLGNIEREVLGIHRHGDVPSSEIPQIWFDYLRNRDATDIKRVFYHHKMDILSLVTITALLSQTLEVPNAESLHHVEDRLSIVRLHFRQKRFDEAVQCAWKLLEAESEQNVRRECLELLALGCKRIRDWERMEETLDLMTREFPSYLLPRLELAKHHEHRSRNLTEALRICRETIQYLETRAALDREDDLDSLQAQQFQRRIERLQRKLSKAFPAGDVDA